MSRSLSPTALRAIHDEHTGEVWLPRLTISHPTLSQPIRAVRNGVNIDHAGQTWVAFEFSVDLPSSVAGELPRVRLTLTTITREVVSALRGLSSGVPPLVTLEYVLASDFGRVEVGPVDMTMIGAEYSAEAIIADLAFEDLLNLPYGHSFTPADYPGVFS